MADFTTFEVIFTQMAKILLQDWFRILIIQLSLATMHDQKYVFFECYLNCCFYLISYVGYDLFIYCFSPIQPLFGI